ncbi:hypothetical protein GE09DRAFT_198619 [Coniochaeta sp. 2T2.1]|nr:hypothetical protein GE09DRAFT_198619 [Coniochaeta sp. 2T2.1]
MHLLSDDACRHESERTIRRLYDRETSWRDEDRLSPVHGMRSLIRGVLGRPIKQVRCPSVFAGLTNVGEWRTLRATWKSINATCDISFLCHLPDLVIFQTLSSSRPCHLPDHYNHYITHATCPQIVSVRVASKSCNQPVKPPRWNAITPSRPTIGELPISCECLSLRRPPRRRTSQLRLQIPAATTWKHLRSRCLSAPGTPSPYPPPRLLQMRLARDRPRQGEAQASRPVATNQPAEKPRYPKHTKPLVHSHTISLKGPRDRNVPSHDLRQPPDRRHLRHLVARKRTQMPRTATHPRRPQKSCGSCLLAASWNASTITTGISTAGEILCTSSATGWRSV